MDPLAITTTSVATFNPVPVQPKNVNPSLAGLFKVIFAVVFEYLVGFPSTVPPSKWYWIEYSVFFWLVPPPALPPEEPPPVPPLVFSGALFTSSTTTSPDSLESSDATISFLSLNVSIILVAIIIACSLVALAYSSDFSIDGVLFGANLFSPTPLITPFAHIK